MQMRTIKLEDYERELEARKAVFGYSGNDYVSLNTGASRSEEKRELLRVLAENAEAQGRKPRFPANF
jgi:hypothetical protein